MEKLLAHWTGGPLTAGVIDLPFNIEEFCREQDAAYDALAAKLADEKSKGDPYLLQQVHELLAQAMALREALAWIFAVGSDDGEPDRARLVGVMQKGARDAVKAFDDFIKERK